MSALDAAARDSLLAQARGDAAHLLAAADDEADGVISAARAQAAEMIDRARAQGEAEGREAAAREERQDRTLARMQVLAAQRESYDELCARARAAALELRGAPGYPALVERLSVAARRDLGKDAQLEVDPPDAGGVRASAGSRRVDYTLPAVAERCVRALGPAVRRLWE